MITQEIIYELEAIRAGIEEEFGWACNHLIVNKYENSIGGPRVFRIHEKTKGKWKKKKDIVLPHDSLVRIGYEFNKHFKHSIVKTSTFVQPRISLTFRKVKTKKKLAL